MWKEIIAGPSDCIYVSKASLGCLKRNGYRRGVASLGDAKITRNDGN